MIRERNKPVIGLSLRHIKAFFKVYLLESIAYRASIVIWVGADMFAALTMPLVWLAATKGGEIQGFTGPQFVAYYILIILLSNFITSHFAWDINYEIREGMLTSQLIRPANWLSYMFVRNLAYRCVRLAVFIPFLIVFLIAYGKNLSQVEYFLGWQFWALVVGGHILSFATVVALGMVSLFTEEAEAVFELYYFPMWFLSGMMVPIDVLPHWAQWLAKALPFYYTVGAPTEILIGRVNPADAVRIVGIQTLYIVGMYLLHRMLWKRGLKRYTGVGL